jgi:cation transport ATPase
MVQAEEFSPYEGGISAVVNGERVMTGSAAFMNLLGIRIPDDVNLKNVVFTAVNDRLIAMFAINYVPTNSVQNALISVMKWRIKLFLAVRDFNITPLMLEQKFKVSLEGIEYIPVQNSYTISDLDSAEEGRIAAILTREGFGPFAEVVTCGRLLKSTARISTIVSIISAALGVLMMFYMFWMGSIVSARPGNLLLFMLSMLAAVLVICGYAKFRK